MPRSGIETPTREDLARLDRKRKKKGSNDDWFNPNDPDAKITKMKDGRTHLAHKEEHAVDLDTGAVVAVTLVPASAGDTATIEGTLDAAVQNLDNAREVAGDSQREGEPVEAVADKGYHSKMVLLSLQQEGWRTYIAEPQRGRQKWPDQQAERAAGIRESSTQERTSWPRVDALARRTHRTALRARFRNRRHAAHSPAPPREHREATSRPCRRAQPCLAHAKALRRRKTKVPAGPVGRVWGRRCGIAGLATSPLALYAVRAARRVAFELRRRRSRHLIGDRSTSTSAC
ncbi:MAG: transposase [Nitrospiraceae bacterium]|nr:transposase [Nitrospiraceae bacterium]